MTSAELKLLRRRLTLRSPGRPEVVAGVTTAETFVFTQVSFLSAAPTTSDKDVVCVSRFEGIKVGRRDGTGDGGGLGRRVGTGRGAAFAFAKDAAWSAFAAEVVLVVANRGILFGPCAGGFIGEAGVVTALLVFLIWAALAVDRVTRLGRCSEAVTPREDDFEGFTLVRTGAAPKAGRTSSDSSVSESCASRLDAGVLRGCPGGKISPAFAAAVATCRLGVTGCKVGAVGVVRISTSSSVSAGGVAGVTTVFEAAAAAPAPCCFLASSIAPHFTHSSCLRYIYCCCGPTTLPGRIMRINAMTSLAVKPYFQIK